MLQKYQKRKGESSFCWYFVKQKFGSSSSECFRCGYEDHMIAKCPKPPKDSEKRRKSERSKEKDNRACDNSDDDDELKVYASMVRMSSDYKRENKHYGDSS